MSSSSASQPGAIDANAIHSLLREACAGALPEWLEKRRWFADKGRGISEVAIEHAHVERVGSDWLALAVVRVAFVDGNTARYLLPLAFTGSSGAADMSTAAVRGAIPGGVVDATEKPGSVAGCSTSSSERLSGRGGPGSLLLSADAGAVIAAARDSPTTAVRAEQSNSSLRFGDVLIVKFFRRLQPGLNPDEEVLRALADVGFERVPPYVGSVSWRSGDGATHAVALAQGFVREYR